MQQQLLGRRLVAAAGLQEDQQGVTQPGVVLVVRSRVSASVPDTQDCSNSGDASIIATGATSLNATARGRLGPV